MKRAKRLASLLGILIAGAVSVAQPVRADDEKSPLSLSLATTFATDYMFRGLQLYDGTAIQPSFTANLETSAGTFGGSVWSHLSGEGNRQSEKFTEIDYTVSYAYTLDPAVVKFGHIWYTYPQDQDGAIDATEEVFASLVIDDSKLGSPLALAPTFTVYHDYDLVDGQYYELGLSHLFEGGDEGSKFNFTPFAAFGFASNSEAIYAKNGFVQATFGVSTNVNVGKLLLTPSFSYTAKVDDNTVNEFWFSTTLAFNS